MSPLHPYTKTKTTYVSGGGWNKELIYTTRGGLKLQSPRVANVIAFEEQFL